MVKNKDLCAPEKIICHVLQKLFQAICTRGNNFLNYYFLANVKELGRKCFVGEKEREGMIVGEDISSLMSHSTTSIENSQQSLGSGRVHFCQEIWWGVEKLGH